MLPHNISARVSDCSSCGNHLENYFSFDCTKSDIITKIRQLPREWEDMPLQSPPTSVAQAKKDFRRQKVLLNGVLFTPELNSMSNNDLFSSALYNICTALLQRCPLADVRSTDIAESVMQHSCRSSTGADSFFAVHQLFSIQDTIVAQYENEGRATIEISLFYQMDKGSIFARSDCKNSYSLVDASLIGGEESPSPWLFVDTYIRDELDFKTGAHRRTLTIVPSPQPSACSSVVPPPTQYGGQSKSQSSDRSEETTDADTERDEHERQRPPS